VQWTPGPIKDYFSSTNISPSFCSMNIYVTWVMQESTSMLNLLLAYTLYTSIVKRYDLNALQSYYYTRFLVVIFVPSLLVPLLTFSEPRYNPAVGVCRLITPLSIVIKLANWIFPIFLQIILMIKVIYVVYTVTRAVKDATSSPPAEHAILWICIRFLGAQCGQIIVWFPTTLWDLLYMEAFEPSLSLIVLTAFAPGFLAINGVIIVVGNKSLWDSLSKKYTKFRNYCASFFTAQSLQFFTCAIEHV